MTKLQTQGVHHITLVGADRQTSIDFWSGVLGMAFVFEQPNLDDPETNHLYFDPGDGRLITVFTGRPPSPMPGPTRWGSATCITWPSRCRAPPTMRRLGGASRRAALPTPARSTEGSCIRSTSATRWGSSWSLPATSSSRQAPMHADVLREAHNIRVAKGDYNIADEHLADAIELLSRKPEPKLAKGPA